MKQFDLAFFLGGDRFPAIQALGEQRQVDAIAPNDVGENAPTPAEDIEIAGMVIAFLTLLNGQSHVLHPATHVHVPCGDADPDAVRYRDHRRLRTSRARSTRERQHSRQR